MDAKAKSKSPKKQQSKRGQKEPNLPNPARTKQNEGDELIVDALEQPFDYNKYIREGDIAKTQQQKLTV